MNESLISIIVPVYNAERYLNRCINSIICQDYINWELLLVDDGSPDNSGIICDRYAQKDSRIKVFHKPNGGVSSARNLGIDNAKGEWISFVDADDFISKNYCSAIINANSDIIIVDRYICDLHGNTFESSILKESVGDTRDKYTSIIQENLKEEQFKAPWAKFIKKSCIGSLRYEIGQNIGEDTVFMFDLLAKCSSIEIMNGYIYYWQRGESSFRRKYRIDINHALSYVKRCLSSYEKIGVHNSDLEEFLILFYFKLCRKDTVEDIREWFSDNVISKYSLQLDRNKRDVAKYLKWDKYPKIMMIKDKVIRLYMKAYGKY